MRIHAAQLAVLAFGSGDHVFDIQLYGFQFRQFHLFHINSPLSMLPSHRQTMLTRFLGI